MLGIELKEPPDKLVEKGLEAGVILNVTAKKVIRLAPPINITAEDWDKGLDLVSDVIAAVWREAMKRPLRGGPSTFGDADEGG